MKIFVNGSTFELEVFDIGFNDLNLGMNFIYRNRIIALLGYKVLYLLDFLLLAFNELQVLIFFFV
jgi:hypothetical protein